MPRTPEDIADEDDLYRRLGPDHVKPDGAISRTAFMRNSTVNRNRKEPDPEISVDLARLTTPALTLTRANRPAHGVGSLVAAYPRSLGLAVRHTPTEDNSAIRRSKAIRIARTVTCWPRLRRSSSLPSAVQDRGRRRSDRLMRSQTLAGRPERPPARGPRCLRAHLGRAPGPRRTGHIPGGAMREPPSGRSRRTTRLSHTRQTLDK